ncbi:MAG: RHS repeat-associated core domain-containing protein, partial [Chloroflexi bacterium]|nr:RHS repeat-associated core domain-containing protein [Chloroflexota bacterium]
GDRLTDRGFTGHKENHDIGLTYMNARFYVPGIGRFASADTIVPNPANPQSFNRYSYVLNSPLNFTDPSGHCINGGNNGASGGTSIDDPYYDCSITPPPSTNPTGETMHVQGILRILTILDETAYGDMDIYEASLWWNTMASYVDPFIEPLYDENGRSDDPFLHEDQLGSLRKAYVPGQLEEMAKEPRNNDLSQSELGSAAGVRVDYMNVLISLQNGAQYTPEILNELGLDDSASNFEPNYLNAMYAYNPSAVNEVIAKHLIGALDTGMDYEMYRDVTNKPSDIFSPQRNWGSH